MDTSTKKYHMACDTLLSIEIVYGALLAVTPEIAITGMSMSRNMFHVNDRLMSLQQKYISTRVCNNRMYLEHRVIIIVFIFLPGVHFVRDCPNICPQQKLSST